MERPEIPKIFHFLPLAAWLLVGLAISYFGYTLLLRQFNSYPSVGDTYDEYKAPFNGLSLLGKGYPESWSWYGHYGNFPTRYINGADFRLVRPWFDEPPLFSLIAGLFCRKYGQTDIEHLDITVLRYPMLKFAALNIFLLYCLIFVLQGPAPAIIGSLIYATIPTIVLLARLPLSDNMLVTFTLISILSTVLYLQFAKKVFLIPAILFSALSLQLKSTGVFVPVAVGALLLAFGKIRPLLLTILFTAVSLGLWFAYGYHFGWATFLKTMEVSSGRELFSPTIIINLLHSFRIGEKVMGIDGWVWWGWFCLMFYPFVVRRQNRLSRLIIPVVTGSYLVFFTIMSGHVKGWYRAPFYPFLAWASAAVILQLIRRPRFLPFFFFIAIPFFSSFIYGQGGIRWTNSQIKIYQLLFVSSMIIPMLSELLRHPLLKIAFRFLIIAALILSLFYNYQTLTSFQDFFYYRSL